MPDPTHIEVVLAGASNSIGSHTHPMLESGSLSFPQGRYGIDFEQDSNGLDFHLTHRLQGAPLVERLIEEKTAQYACIVSSPRSAYRKVHLCGEPRQTVRCDSTDLGEPPLFTPLVLCVRYDEVVLDSARDGVHEIWNGQRVEFNEGSRIALGNVIQLQASISHLLSLHADESIRKGGFKIQIESEPFGFRAYLHPDLHQFVQYGKGPVFKQLMTHIVTACLAALQRERSDDNGEEEDDEDYGGGETNRARAAFAEHLMREGLPHWDDDNFFPEEVATALYPLDIAVDDAHSTEGGD